jgi:prepilin-type N-terminal cleavage/methylation domain-containing protein
MNNIRKHNRPGFTLIELLAVIAVIAIISTIATISFSNIRSKQRDAQRITDIKKIIIGLEQYKNIYGDFPECEIHFFCDYPNSPYPNYWKNCLGEALKPFLGEIPVDPVSSPGKGYCYKTGFRSTGNQISLVYYLENFDPNSSGFGKLNVLKNLYGTTEYEVIIKKYRD